MVYFFHFPSFLDQNDSTLNYIAILCQILGFYLKAILPETSPFLFAQMAVLNSFFKMFIVLGMYNFGENIRACHDFISRSCKQSVLESFYEKSFSFKLNYTRTD